MQLITVHYTKSPKTFSFSQFTDYKEAQRFAVWLAIEKGYTGIHMDVKGA
jgi:hypothetical protein